jgi:hypothetical protein
MNFVSFSSTVNQKTGAAQEESRTPEGTRGIKERHQEDRTKNAGDWSELQVQRDPAVVIMAGFSGQNMASSD